MLIYVHPLVYANEYLLECYMLILISDRFGEP